MKLIDLLVQELPKRGGWPKDAEYCHLTQYDRHCLTIVFSHWQTCTGNNLTTSKEEMVFSGIGYLGDTLYGCIVTAKEYESALAASQKPVWNGEGVPPVGAKVEFFINPKLGYCNDWIPDAGTEMEVVAHKTTTDGNDVAVCYWDEGGAGRSCCFVPKSLKPLRTDAEKKRDAFINAVLDDMRVIPCDLSLRDEVAVIYDAIAAGKIPGVKLDD